MTEQNVFNNQSARPGFAGQLDGLHHVVDSGINGAGMKVQEHDVNITAADSTAYTLTLNSSARSVTSGVGATIESIRDLFFADIRAVEALNDAVILQPTGTGFRIIARKEGVGFTFSESDGNLTNAAVQANGTLEPVPFGAGVCEDLDTTLDKRSIKLPAAVGDEGLFKGVAYRDHSGVDAANSVANEYAPGKVVSIVKQGRVYVLTSEGVSRGKKGYLVYSGADKGKFRDEAGGTLQLDYITISATTDGRYAVTVDGVEAEFTAAGNTADEIVQGIADAVSNMVREQDFEIDVVADLANDRVELTFLDGSGHTVETADGGTAMAVTTQTAGTGALAFEVPVKFLETTTVAGAALCEVAA